LPPIQTDPYAWIEQSLTTIHSADWYRSVQTLQHRPGAVVQLEGRSVINFASNDYLGLAGDERLIQAAIAATKEFGTGSTGSRLLSGHRELHRELEKAIAFLKQTEDALVFSSGYLANLGTIAALVGKRDLILSDQYNHSSLKNGSILSGAVVVNYAHNDMEELKSQLEQHRQQYRRGLIITDSVFSMDGDRMDGDLCPMPEILAIAKAFSCMVLVDEAHATGVLGATGAGCVEHFSCKGQSLIQVGTLSKALGSLGGYVAGSASLIDFLRNRAEIALRAGFTLQLYHLLTQQQHSQQSRLFNKNQNAVPSLVVMCIHSSSWCKSNYLIFSFYPLNHLSSAFNSPVQKMRSRQEIN